MPHKRRIGWCLIALLVAGCAPGAPSAAEAIPSPTVLPPASTGAPEPLATPTEESAPTPTPDLAPTAPVAPIARLHPGQSVTVTRVRMHDTAAGWGLGGEIAVGDHVLRTDDGGETWRDVTPPEPAPGPGEPGKVAVGFFLDASSAWATYYLDPAQEPPVPVVWRTRDGGGSWEASQPLDTGDMMEPYQPSDIRFVDDRNGWLLVHRGAGMNHDYVSLYRTADGGESWAQIVDPASDNSIQSCYKTGIVFADPQTGWLTRDCYGVVPGLSFDRTSDGGATWQSQPLPPPAEAPDLFDRAFCGVYSPHLFSPQAGVLAVTCNDMNDPAKQSHYLYATTDGGQAWNTHPFPGGALQLLSPNVGWALAQDIHQTHDGGNTWTRAGVVSWDGQFSFVDDRNGWAVARSGEDIALVRTSNAGRTWQLLQPRVAEP